MAGASRSSEQLCFCLPLWPALCHTATPPTPPPAGRWGLGVGLGPAVAAPGESCNPGPGLGVSSNSPAAGGHPTALEPSGKAERSSMVAKASQELQQEGRETEIPAGEKQFWAAAAQGPSRNNWPPRRGWRSCRSLCGKLGLWGLRRAATFSSYCRICQLCDRARGPNDRLLGIDLNANLGTQVYFEMMRETRVF